ncbi:hypothetical protein IJG14_00070, partial [bacterium]|nr:hypothetical protein [bacterium]
SFKLMKKNELKLITAYKNNLFLKPEDYWKHYIKYCNIDKEITERTDFSQYRHVFLNGKIIKHISKYKADNFVILKDGTILGFTGLKRNFAETPLGILFVDVDGFSMRNFIGKDVFILLIYPDRIEPMGNNSSIQEMKEDCSAIGSGLKCSAYYLVGSSF